MAWAMRNTDSIPHLLNDVEVQIEATEGVNSMYNFQFKRADAQFRWLKKKYAWHPLPYFLLGLSQWWRIAPNIEETRYDKALLRYMDSAIVVSKSIFAQGSQVEGGFFLSAAHAFKGRYYAERDEWLRAAREAKEAMNYLEYCRGQEGFGAEILLGDGLYNYYLVWIRENYPIIKPILIFFKGGDKALGIAQLKEVAKNAFFTRTEAQYFLMKILSDEADQRSQARFIAHYLHTTFPDNPVFERDYAQLLYLSGDYDTLKAISHNILSKLHAHKIGYAANSGRKAAFFLAEVYSSEGHHTQAEEYYTLSVEYGDEAGAQKMGYHLYSLLALGRYAAERGAKKLAKSYYKQVKKLSSRRKAAHQLAKTYLKEL